MKATASVTSASYLLISFFLYVICAQSEQVSFAFTDSVIKGEGDYHAGSLREEKLLTIFSTFKPAAKGSSTYNIQRNAAQSWTLLDPRPEVLLFGDDEGTAEIAREFGITHIPTMARNEYGLPYVNNLFYDAQRHAQADLLMYTNGDIMFTNDLMEVVKILRDKRRAGAEGFSEFLVIGKNWRTHMDKPIADFSSAGLKTRAHEARERNHVSLIWAMDYFLFTKDLWGPREDSIPPFILGVMVFDNWLVHKVHMDKKTTLDASEVVTAMQAYHPPSHASPQQKEMKKYNEGLAQKWYFGNVDRTTHRLVYCEGEEGGNGGTVNNSICIVRR